MLTDLTFKNCIYVGTQLRSEKKKKMYFNISAVHQLKNENVSFFCSLIYINDRLQQVSF